MSNVGEGNKAKDASQYPRRSQKKKKLDLFLTSSPHLAQPQNPSIAQQDTVTGFLLAGVGHVDLRRQSNFFIVTDSESSVFFCFAFFFSRFFPLTLSSIFPKTCKPQTLTPTTTTETPVPKIEAAFLEYTRARKDVGVVLITQRAASDIRHLVAAHSAAVPALLEIPSSDAPYSAEADSVFQRVKMLFGGDLPAAAAVAGEGGG